MLQKMKKIADNPIDIDAINKQSKGKTPRLSTIAKRNPNFKLDAFQKIYTAKLSDRLL